MSSFNEHSGKNPLAILAGVMMLTGSVIAYGLNVLFARLSQLTSLMIDSSFMPELLHYFDPVLTGSGIILLIGGIVVVVCGVHQKCRQ